MKTSTGLKVTAYREIRRRLVAGRLGPGSHVSELGLSKELGMSRSPVREAISRLVTEGILDESPGTGACVKTLARADLEDLYQFREWVEGEAVAEAARRIDRGQLAHMERACAEMRAIADAHRRSADRFASPKLLRRLMEADMAFHASLLRSSGNRRAMKHTADYRFMLWVWCRLPDRLTLRHLALLYRQHSQVLRAVRHGDAQAARRYLRRFIREGRDKTLRLYDWRQRQVVVEQEAELIDSQWRDGAEVSQREEEPPSNQHN